MNLAMACSWGKCNIILIIIEGCGVETMHNCNIALSTVWMAKVPTYRHTWTWNTCGAAFDHAEIWKKNVVGSRGYEHLRLKVPFLFGYVISCFVNIPFDFIETYICCI